MYILKSSLPAKLAIQRYCDNLLVGAYSVVNFRAPSRVERYENSFKVLKEVAAQRGLRVSEDFVSKFFFERLLGQWIYAGLCIFSMLGALVAAKTNEKLAFSLALVAPALAVTVAVLYHRLVSKSQQEKTSSTRTASDSRP